MLLRMVWCLWCVFTVPAPLCTAVPAWDGQLSASRQWGTFPRTPITEGSRQDPRAERGSELGGREQQQCSQGFLRGFTTLPLDEGWRSGSTMRGTATCSPPVRWTGTQSAANSTASWSCRGALRHGRVGSAGAQPQTAIAFASPGEIMRGMCNTQELAKLHVYPFCAERACTGCQPPVVLDVYNGTLRSAVARAPASTREEHLQASHLGCT
jgi:hypothetical protein